VNILAIDTSTEACSAALWIDGQRLERYQVAPGAHSRLILPMIEDLFAECGLALRDMHAVAFGRGPGSFTGLRIAAGVVQGLAYGADLPVVPVSTLEAVAQGELETRGQTHVLVALDARMGEVYWGGYELGPDARFKSVIAECVTPAAAAPKPAGGAWFGAGPGWNVHGAALMQRLGTSVTASDPDALPRAAHLLPIAVAALARGEAVAPEAAVPVYLRDQVAHVQG
jgi:tRNA threonylcarbamoyladenosine biosynthesis protein TsaB